MSLKSVCYPNIQFYKYSTNPSVLAILHKEVHKCAIFEYISLQSVERVERSRHFVQ